ADTSAVRRTVCSVPLSRSVCGGVPLPGPDCLPLRRTVCRILAVRHVLPGRLAVRRILAVRLPGRRLRPLGAPDRRPDAGTRGAGRGCAAQVRATLAAGSAVGVAEALLDVRVVVSNAQPMRRIVLPLVADVSDVGDVKWRRPGPISDDVAVAPIDAAAPAPVARAPVPECVPGTEPEAARQHAGADAISPIVWISPIIRRVVGVRPRAEDDARIVGRNIDRVVARLLDDDGPPIVLL